MPAHPPPTPDERSQLLAYLEQQRDGLRNAAFGLTDDQARSAPSVSTLTVGGLVKHVTRTEEYWVDLILQRERPGADEAGYDHGFTMAPDETLAGLLAAYDAVAAETVAVVGSIDDLNQPVPVPRGVPWFPADLDAWTVRWVLLHIIEETARHAGHADIVRESIDGATMYELLAAAEGWPATDWLTPWSPPA
jgi:uncharacterized damage-inducible protein DinB